MTGRRPAPSKKDDKSKDLPIIKDDYGNIVNPYIPRFIVKTPWYLAEKQQQEDQDAEQPHHPHQTLKHQRIEDRDGPKGEIMDPEYAPTRENKKCSNCGLLGHAAEECVDRPSAKRTKQGGKEESVTMRRVQTESSFDAKRDRWSGYDAEEYVKIIQERTADTLKETTCLDSDDDDEGETNRKTGQGLRLREDTAKYLRDVRSESAARYDPKTRSMRGEEVDGAFVPSTASDVQARQVFAWQASKRGTTLHAQAGPSELEKAFREEEARRGRGLTKLPKDDYRYNY